MWFRWHGPWFIGLVGFFGLLVLCTGAFLCFSLSPCGSFFYTPCILLGALLSFAQYIAFIDKKKKVLCMR